MPRLAYKKSMSLGEAISSVCFFGVGIVWLSQGMDMIDAEAYWRAAGLFICGLVCLAACFRYVIQNTMFKLFVGFDEDEKPNQ